MNRRNHLLIAALTVAIGVLVWQLFSGSDHPAAPIGDLDRAIDVHAAGELGAAAGPNPAARELPHRETGSIQDAIEPDEYRRALCGLTGRLIWKESREPIAGVAVRGIELRLDVVAPTLETAMGLAAAPDPVIFHGRSVTDADGRFRLEGLHWRAALLLGIGLRTDKAAVRFVDRMPAGGAVSDLGDIELMQRGSVSGAVVDGAGAPVAGARVRVVDVPRVLLQFGVSQYDPEGLIVLRKGPLSQILPLPHWAARYDRELPFADARSDADGKFVVRGARPGQSTVLVQVRGKRTATKSLRVRALHRASVGTIRLASGGALSGRVVDAAGAPVPAARIAVGAILNVAPIGFFPKPRTVAPDGRFRATGLPRGRLFVAYQRAPGAPWELDGPHRAGDDVEIRVPALVTGEIAVVDQRGEPVAQATIRIGPADKPAAAIPGLERFLDPQHITKARSPGVWNVRDVPGQAYRVLVRAKGFALGVGLLDLRAESLAKDPAKGKATIRLLSASTTTFEVVTTDGRPIAGARIYWWHGRSVGDARISVLPILLGSTDVHGRLQSDFIEATASKFFVRHPGYALTSTGQTTSDGQGATRGRTIRFVLRAGGDVAGLVVEDGGPPHDTTVVMASPSGEHSSELAPVQWPRLTWTHPNGKFRFAQLDPGNWRFQPFPKLSSMDSFASATKLWRLTATGDWTEPVAARVRAGRTTHITLDLSRHQETGAGSITGSVRVGGKPGVGLFVSTYAGRSLRVPVDASGNFRMSGIPDGEFFVTVVRGGDAILNPTLWSGSTTVKDGREAHIDVDLQVGHLTVIVTDPAGSPVSGLPLLLQRAEPTAYQRALAVTDDNGAANFREIPTATYDIRAEGNGADSWVLPQTRVTVRAGTDPATRKLTAVAPIALSGSIRLDYTGLSKQERAFASEAPPQWFEFKSGGNGAWGRIESKADQRRYRLRRLAPGHYRVVCSGNLPWTTQVTVRGSGSQTLDLTVKPDQAAIQRKLQARAARKRR